MRANITYSDYLTSSGGESIEKISISLDDNKFLEFQIIPPVLETDQAACGIKMIDDATVSEVKSEITREEFADLIALVRKMSTQF